MVRADGAIAWRLAARSPTLDGNVPLRAARSCPPLLAGNAFGLHFTPPKPLVVRRGLRSVEAGPSALSARAVDGGTVAVDVDTGLELEASTARGLAWVVGRPFNRRDRRVDVVEREVVVGERVVLRLLIALRRGESITLGNEVATLAPFVTDLPIAVLPLGDAAPLGSAFAAFFDDGYFAGKRGRATNAYRDRMRAGPEPTMPTRGIVCAHAGGAPPRASRGPGDALEIRIAAELDVELGWHGRRVEIAMDPRALARRAAALEASLDGTLGRGASLYFTTYATPHAPGDPHVFFKPATLVSTPPDVVAVVDGPSGDGLEAMRGVVETSWFHALPAVAEMVAPRARLIPGGDLVRVRFAPAALVTPAVSRRESG